MNPTPAVNEPAKPEPSLPEAPEASNTPENLEVWHPTVQAIAQTYESWGRVDDEMLFAPFLCRLPQPGNLLLSKSGDADTHGQKIYSLYAFDPVAYGAPPSMMMPKPEGAAKAKPLAVKQAIVKEAFVPKQVDSPLNNRHQPKPAVKDGKFFDKGEKAGLYIMLQPSDPADGSPEQPTDAGWIYATVTPEGQVTAAGQVKNCMGCHEKNPKRVFGLAQNIVPTPQARGPNGEKVLNPAPTNR